MDEPDPQVPEASLQRAGAQSGVAGVGTLVLIGTPLGNRGDLSPRARAALLGADLLFCEDTRSPNRLLAPLAEGEQLPPRISCFVGNEHQRLERLREHLGRGETVAFVSEAGLPVWSDPGRILVAAAVAAGFPVDVVPGPTAGTCALALSGFPAEGARFLGFCPRAGKDRVALLESLVDESGAAVFYEAGNRVPALLRDLDKDMGERRIVVARELTKLHQEVLRGTVAELHGQGRGALRGEVTLVLAGAPARDPNQGEAVDPAVLAARAAVELFADRSLKPRARAKALAALTGWDARALYDKLARPS